MSSGSSSSGLGFGEKEKAHLVSAGFATMLDPPRKGVTDAVALLQSGGVQVVMITGDSEETALSVARSLGLRGTTGAGACLTGAALDRITAAQLCERVGSVSVFARTSPKHKMAIVGAFQARGAVVAMTGDGGKYLPFFACLFYGSDVQLTTRCRLKWRILGYRWARVGRTSRRKPRT